MRDPRVQFHEVRETLRCKLEGNKDVSYVRHRGACVPCAAFDGVILAFTQTNKRPPLRVGREAWGDAVDSLDPVEMLSGYAKIQLQSFFLWHSRNAGVRALRVVATHRDEAATEIRQNVS
jgi:hypothetical protein